MLEKLKNLNIDRMDLDEAIALATLGRATANGYDYYKVPAPKWLENGLRMLDEEINRRRKELLQSRLREVEAEQTALRTREERRADLTAEHARLQAELAG